MWRDSKNLKLPSMLRVNWACEIWYMLIFKFQRRTQSLMEPAVSITNYQLISVQTIISNAEFPNLDLLLVNMLFSIKKWGYL